MDSKMLLSAIVTVMVAFLAWLAVNMIDVRDRVSDLQATTRENKEERQAQIAELRQRVYDLERRERGDQ